MLGRLLSERALLHLSAPDGASYTTTLWALDAAHDRLSLAVDALGASLTRLLDSDEITVVGYLDSIKVQFDLAGSVLINGARDSVISAEIPREMFRFQRRDTFRVRPLARNTPTLSFSHPMIPDMRLALRVLDVSIGGLAVCLPDTVPAIAPGLRINGATLELDADTRIRGSLMLHHVTRLNPEMNGGRLGCEWLDLAAETGRVLQRYIDQTQKRRRLLLPE